MTPPDDLSGPHDGFDLAVALVLAPRLPPDRLTVVRDYPPEHAALARVRETPEGPVAERFELYWGPLELANGYQELTDPAEQRRRFEAANAARRAAGRLAWPLDGRFLAALEAGMPPAAGVALGLDRVLMRLAGAESLAEVMPFADDYPVVEQGRDEP
ncbi:MAG: hypothetical protein KatS3mg121_0254 [Gammaproteobacteria bacterium]|nr:MAG: hypothetical protein KatS3mg121_0254 [Gammaproteobacteria bacterium]